MKITTISRPYSLWCA